MAKMLVTASFECENDEMTEEQLLDALRANIHKLDSDLLENDGIVTPSGIDWDWIRHE